MKSSVISGLALVGMAVTGVSAMSAKMDSLKSIKVAQWEQQRQDGVFDEDQYMSIAASTACVNGKAGEYSCDKVDMMAFLSHQDMGSRTRMGNDVWGTFTILTTIELD